MAERNEQEELIFKAQGLTEAIELLSKYEEILQGLVDAPGSKDLIDAFDSLGERTADIQERFKPHLSTLALFSAQMNNLQARIEEKNVEPTGGELNAVSNVLANLQSELRTTHQEIDSFDKWVDATRDDLLLEVAGLSDALQNIHRIFEFSNSLRAGDPQSEIFRETVIKLLNAAIEELKAPAVNVSRLQSISRFLTKVLKKSAEKQLGDTADTAIDEAIKQSGKVADLAKTLPGIEGLF